MALLAVLSLAFTVSVSAELVLPAISFSKATRQFETREPGHQAHGNKTNTNKQTLRPYFILYSIYYYYYYFCYYYYYIHSIYTYMLLYIIIYYYSIIFLL